MKTLKNILMYFAFGLTGLLAIPFVFVEFRNFFSFEFINMNSPFVNGLAYFLRGLYFLLILALAVFSILFIAKKKKFCIILFATGVALFIGALLSLLFFEYYVSLILIVVTLIQLVIISVGFFEKEKEEEPSSCLVNG